MILDFYHNKIVKETVTDAFIASVRETLLPKLSEKYGDGLSGIQMYEDYISDGIVKDGIAYYPMTVILGDSHSTEWISYPFDSATFKNGVPFSYIGEGSLEFSLEANVPAEIKSIINGRRTYYASALGIEISTPLEALKLSGKYSQSFIDTLAEKVIAEIEKNMSIRGLSDSGLILEMPFAPETYMEHTSENVTYRRLLISDKNSSAKDLWVKWTREMSAVGFTVSDHVIPEEITVELGEDVSQKIREKEYRFLTRVSPAKYQSAMGRKNVTEWRELIKRAIKRGDVEKVEIVIDEAAHSSEVSDKLAEILGKMGYTGAPGAIAEEDAAPDDELLRVLRTVDSIADALTPEAESEDDDAAEEIETTEEIPEDETEEAEDETEEDAEMLDFAPKGLELTLTEDETEDEIEEAEAEDEIEEAEEAEAEDEVEEAEEAEAEDGAVDERDELIHRLYEEKIRLEAEAQQRLLEEAERRRLAEEETERLRAIEKRLAEENERLMELARAAEREKEREAEIRRAEAEALRREIEALRREIEAQKMAELRERERLRDAAVAELEERKRLEEEAKRAEEERLAEEARQKAEAEAARIEEEREAERRRLLAEYTAEEQYDVAAPAPEVKYTSYTVKLIFRHSVDPNSMVRIQELIKTTVAYFGKEHLKIRIKASIPDSMTVKLDFISIPESEHELLVNIIKVLGNSDLGISKAILD